MGDKLKAYLQLCRPANLPTAAADSAAGLALAGFFYIFYEADVDINVTVWLPMVKLLLASIFLYAGGVVLNDVFDAELDRVERPERPIPKGRVSRYNASVFGGTLLVLGVLISFWVTIPSGFIALILVGSIVLYDGLSKKHRFFGPLNMGVCRALNLLLGLSVFGEFKLWPYAFIPLVFIAAVTMVSRGEVHGNNKKNILRAAFLYKIVIFCVIGFHEMTTKPMLHYLLFLGLFALLVFKPLASSYAQNNPDNIRRAVKAGVLSIIVLDAAIAVGHSHWAIGLLLVLLLPLSIFLSKIFAVT
ncbi:MAG: UbiA-like protein EboC [Bacteroidota bacterium]